MFSYPSLSSVSDSVASTGIHDSTGGPGFQQQQQQQQQASAMIKNSTIKNLTPQFMMNEGCNQESQQQTEFDSVSSHSVKMFGRILSQYLLNRILEFKI
jgi:hypothetical protein